MRRFLRSLAPLFILVLLAGFGLKACNRPPAEATKPIALTWWGVFEQEEYVRPLINAFQQKHANISITFRKFRFEEYEDELLNALAEDRGPDIFSIHHTWVGRYVPKISPMPSTITLPIQVQQGTIKKEIVTQLQTERGVTPLDLRTRFLDVVAEDVVRMVAEKPEQPPVERVFGLPLSMDTMVLYANRDLLNAARIPEPAHTWDQLQQHVRTLTRVTGDRIMQAGAGIGTSANVPRATDLLTLLMMQNGAVMANDRGVATFDQIPENTLGRDRAPGLEALEFYTDFANPAKEVYTWNADLPDAFEMFVQGRLAYFFGYAYHLPTIRARAPKIRLTIAPVPQIDGNPEVHIANYWVQSVSKRSKRPEAAWGFVQFMTNIERARSYTAASKQPPALRALVGEFLDDPDLAAFMGELLTTKSWYKGVNAAAMEKILRELIDAGNRREVELDRAIEFAANQVDQTLR